MNALERRKFELHADTDEYRRRIEQAADWVHKAFHRFENPVLNYSGGKDSLVLLHLTAHRCGYDVVPVFHFDNGLLQIPGVTRFVRASVARIGGNLIVASSEKANSEEMVTEEGHGYAGFWGQHHYFAEQNGWDARLLGIRAAESNKRRDRFDTEEGRLPVSEETPIAVAPIHQLKTRDVWAYIVANDLEYHEIYDKGAALYGSIEDRANRLVTLYDSEFDCLGSQEISQHLYPSKTNRLKAIEQGIEGEQ